MKKIYEDIIKRFLDIVLCSFALVVLSPVLLLTAFSIKVSSKGPIFYYSYRNGKNKVPFKFYKFRSMHIANGNDKGLCIADADRVFFVGKVIRRLKIDELPQLINVIQGNMSIVGPRPMATDSVDDFYSGPYERINSIRPGLTSPASLFDYIVGDTYKNEADYRREIVPKKLKMEMYYVDHENIVYDTTIVIRTMVTIIQVFLGRKKYISIPEVQKIES